MAESRPFAEVLMDLITSRPEPTYAFAEQQVVRVRSTLDTNVHAVRDLLGRRGVVVKRYRTMIAGELWYEVEFGGDGGRVAVEPFREDELDGRFARKSPDPTARPDAAGAGTTGVEGES